MMSVAKGLAALSAVAVIGFATPSQAAVELITNGNFSSTYSTGTQSASTPSQLNYNGYGVTGWTSAPNNAYNFIFNPNLSGSAAYTSVGQYNPIQLYTSANGGCTTCGANNAPSSLVSPTGGNFLAGDGAFQTGAVSQLVNGLTAGTVYTLSFYWAAAQQAGFTGNTTESWGVTFGNQSFSTATVTNPSTGFTPWTKVTYNFTASATSQTLSFLAAGGPSGGQPPFSLLDGVSLVAAPEPATWAVMVAGLGLVGFLTVRRRRTGGTPTLAA